MAAPAYIEFSELLLMNIARYMLSFSNELVSELWMVLINFSFYTGVSMYKQYIYVQTTSEIILLQCGVMLSQSAIALARLISHLPCPN